ncbi:MAG: hypothetical protein AABY27_06605 [Pseudomonadota bacterium]
MGCLLNFALGTNNRIDIASPVSQQQHNNQNTQTHHQPSSQTYRGPQYIEDEDSFDNSQIRGVDNIQKTLYIDTST